MSEFDQVPSCSHCHQQGHVETECPNKDRLHGSPRWRAALARRMGSQTTTPPSERKINQINVPSKGKNLPDRDETHESRREPIPLSVILSPLSGWLDEQQINARNGTLKVDFNYGASIINTLANRLSEITPVETDQRVRQTLFELENEARRLYRQFCRIGDISSPEELEFFTRTIQQLKVLRDNISDLARRQNV